MSRSILSSIATFIFAAGCVFSQGTSSTQTIAITNVGNEPFLAPVANFNPGSAMFIYLQPAPSLTATGYTVAFNGQSQSVTTLNAVSDSQGNVPILGILATIPLTIQPGLVSVVVSYAGTSSLPYTITIHPYAPQILQTTHVSDGNAVTVNEPAQPGESLASVVKGLGGSFNPSLPPTLTIGGASVPISTVSVNGAFGDGIFGYTGSFTYKVPSNSPIGFQPFVLTIDGFTSPATSLPIGNPPYPAVPVVTSVNTAGSPGSAGIAQNTWTEIHGTNLAPTTTASAGGVSVTVNGKPAYVYFVCGAATDAKCMDDQINVLTPLDTATGLVSVVVNNGMAASAPYSTAMQTLVPSFFLLAANHVAATPLNNSTTGPKAGETIAVYATGFGLQPDAITERSSLPVVPICKIAGIPATVGFAGLISPGLYQLNITVPSVAPIGDDAISCAYGDAVTQVGSLLTVGSN